MLKGAWDDDVSANMFTSSQKEKKTTDERKRMSNKKN